MTPRSFLSTSACVALFACGDSHSNQMSTDPTNTPPQVDWLVVEGPASYVLLTGATLQYRATAKKCTSWSGGGGFPQTCNNWQDVRTDFLWESSQPAVASVSNDGLVTALTPGETTITVTASDHGETMDLAVVEQFLPLKHVTAGGPLSCGLDANSSAYCWGYTMNGIPPLTFAVAFGSLFPVPVMPEVRFQSMVSGDSTACGIAVDGTAHCGEPHRIMEVVGGAFTVLTTGARHMCGLDVDSAALCWGHNTSGQLGHDSSEECDAWPVPVPCSVVPEAVQGNLAFTTISAGGGHTCALTANGAAYCWGRNASGQLGVDSASGNAPVLVNAAQPFVEVRTGRSHTCALTAGGEVLCWGDNRTGQLGAGTLDSLRHPAVQKVSGDIVFTSIDAGDWTCGLTTDGDVHCWGLNHYYGAIPRLVPGNYTFSEFSVGGKHACGVSDTDGVLCWGENPSGGLGAYTAGEASDTPVHIAGPVLPNAGDGP